MVVLPAPIKPIKKMFVSLPTNAYNKKCLSG
jgi:hypothetical protein